MSTYSSTQQESDGTERENDSYSEITCKSGGAEILEGDDGDPWKGPFPEYTKYGTLTGSSYVRCRDCGLETLTGRKDFASHRDGCKHGDE